MPRRRSGLDPDNALTISLNAGAVRRLREGIPVPDVIDQLRDEAAGRRDLLGIAAGGHIGHYLGTPGTTNPDTVLAAACLILAGADPHTVKTAADQSRRNIEAPRYAAPTVNKPPGVE